jgi:hypothetical protein
MKYFYILNYLKIKNEEYKQNYAKNAFGFDVNDNPNYMYDVEICFLPFSEQSCPLIHQHPGIIR